MTSHDVREVLNLPNDGAAPRPTKKQRTTAPRPNLKGLAREVQNLGGDNPIAIVPAISSFKKRRFGTRKPAAKWEMRPFRNSARQDGTLILSHWRRKDEIQPPSRPEPNPQHGQDEMETDQKEEEELEDSSFAKFNVKVHIPEYSDDQYNSSLVSNSWTKEETDYLLETVRDFDLRWEIIWDRYDYQPKSTEPANGHESGHASTAVVQAKRPRTMEELKSRYYEVAARMMTVTKPVQYMNADEIALHKIMTSFDPAAEGRRKIFAENQLGRSKEEAREEESLLIEVKRIVARQDKFNLERRELYNRLDYPQTETTQDLSVFKTSAGLNTLFQNLMNVDKSKKRKSIMGTDGQNTPVSAGPSAHPGSTPAADPRRESIALSTTSGHRDSISAADGRPERPTKKGAIAQPQERRKLTEQEEQIYGVVTTVDRLSSGPTFRYEKINKILTTKSNAQHQRITNTLAELDVPSRLNMPTKDVVDQMERLLNNVQTLLDLRKISDKLDGEIKVEQAKKAERDKTNPPTQPKSKTAGEDTAATSAAAASGDAGEAEEKAAEVKRESAEDKAPRPTSSGGRKRSASEISGVSDQSSKRQKK
ncbi:SWR1-complex protein 4 [Truncatella angustata]|uniref:SWR1-complex protein 4 n=1 Tax=Truncatella angustata TaxID=152316 RepID=A0A9P8ZXA5_9PEZI|nr:SWR1-complex protein 4 [Truncatella angustata]KAH6652804.1 SWR1-complex protein 4 [Truncatella angustata]